MENIKKLKSLFSEFENQIDNFILLHESPRTYPDENRQLIEKNISFYEIDKNISQFQTKDSLAYMNELYIKVKLISENEEVIESISMFIFGFIDLWGNYWEVKNNVVNLISKYSNKINNYISNFKVDNSEINTKKTKKKVTGLFNTIFFDEIVKYCYLGEDLFDKELEEGTPFKKIQNRLRYFINKNFDKLNPSLDFNAKYDYLAYYIVSKIADISNIKYTEIKNITIKKSDFSEKKRAQAFTKRINPKIEEKDPDFMDFIHEIDGILSNIIKTK